MISPTIVFLFLQPYYFINRSLIVYDYFFVTLLIFFNVRTIWLCIIFAFIFLLDSVFVFSKLYLFNPLDFLNLIKYSINYTFTIVQLILILIVIIAFGAIYFVLRGIKRNIIANKYFFVILGLFVTCTFILDNINGTSSKLRNSCNLSFYNGNIASSPCFLLYIYIKNLNLNVNAPVVNTRDNESITFKKFALDTSGNQMLVILESFGLIKDSIKRKRFEASISSIFESKHWKTSWGKTPFSGSTTNAEMRELLNCSADYRYFNNYYQANKYVSIFNIKKKQRYHLYAIHSFNGDMFERGNWWRNIGIDNIFFSSDVQFNNKFQNTLNYETPFISVNDEDAFNFIQDRTSNKIKQFTYLLTVNTHLVYKGIPKEPIVNNLFDISREPMLSDHAKKQNKRILNLLSYLALHIDPEKYQKILIVGDHMPPFEKERDRFFYDDKFVPFLFIER